MFSTSKKTNEDGTHKEYKEAHTKLNRKNLNINVV